MDRLTVSLRLVPTHFMAWWRGGSQGLARVSVERDTGELSGQAARGGPGSLARILWPDLQAQPQALDFLLKGVTQV